MDDQQNKNETNNAAVRFDGSDEQFWNAVAVYNDPDSEEVESIAAAILLQQVLILAQDALTRPVVSESANVLVPAKVVAKPKPGEVVTVDRAVELFADRWVLRPFGLADKDSALSAVRDYRVHEGQLQYNASYPAEWRESAGTVSDCPQWLVVVQQTSSADGAASNGTPAVRSSRTSLRPAS